MSPSPLRTLAQVWLSFFGTALGLSCVVVILAVVDSIRGTAIIGAVWMTKFAGDV